MYLGLWLLGASTVLSLLAALLCGWRCRLLPKPRSLVEVAAAAGPLTVWQTRRDACWKCCGVSFLLFIIAAISW